MISVCLRCETQTVAFKEKSVQVVHKACDKKRRKQLTSSLDQLLIPELQVRAGFC